jgi:hypothetical protein
VQRAEGELRRLARRADWLASRWVEFPDVAARHRMYANRFRGANARLWLSRDRRSLERVTDARLRRLAWRAYWQAVAPREPDADPRAAAMRLKVDSYWARELWTLIGGDEIRLSVLQARDFELQQLVDSLPEYPPGPPLLAWMRQLRAWLDRFSLRAIVHRLRMK